MDPKFPRIGASIGIRAGQENNIYVVRGIDPTTNMIWLAIADPNYDGYSGDGLYSWNGHEKVWQCHLTDDRSSLPHKLDESFSPVE